MSYYYLVYYFNRISRADLQRRTRLKFWILYWICPKLTIKTPEWLHWALFWCLYYYLGHGQCNIPDVNLLYATGFFLYPQKTSENRWFSDVFRGYWKKPVAEKGFLYSFLFSPLNVHLNMAKVINEDSRKMHVILKMETPEWRF